MGDRRIEPTFDGVDTGAGAGLSVSEEDRIVPQQRKGSKARKNTKTARGAPAGRTAARRRPGKRKSARRRRGGGGWFSTLVRRTAYWTLVLGIWAGIAGVGLIAYYGAQMPSVATWSIPDRPPNVKILAVDGRLVANRGMMGGESIGLHEMSPYIPQAVVAMEDRRFYSHFGVDPIGLARAMVANVTSGRIVEGGSTLTQQLAKNIFLSADRTIERKVQEVLMAFWLEHRYTKDQILEMYLNRVYFGSGAYGVEAASRRYFGKSAREVTLSEAALLAGLLVAPSRLSPARDPKAAEARAQLVLAAMREEGMIGDSELATAMSAPPTRVPAHWSGSENYVADRVMGELPRLVGDVRDDVIVETTVDLHLQALAEEAIRETIDANREALDVTQGALVSIDRSGAVRAMVGGYDYANSQFDRASEARRQPGSTFKAFVFLAALEQGMFPDTVRNDAPVRIGNWTPENYAGKYYGPVTLATALSKSLNSVAVRLTAELGPAAVVEAAWRMGIQSDLEPNASIALGTSEVTPLELTSAFVPFATGGLRPETHFIEKVTTVGGEVLYERRHQPGPRVVRAEIIGMMNAMMHMTVEEGTGRAADFGWPAAGKTGTSQNSRDAWFVGYTANLVTGVWLGNDDGRPMRNVTGGALPARAWKMFMEGAHEGVPVASLPGNWRPGTFKRIEDILAAGRAGPQPASYPQGGTTGSIAAPRPAGEVGETQRSGPIGSIMDIIMGN